jgi:hypothetical protein
VTKKKKFYSIGNGNFLERNPFTFGRFRKFENKPLNLKLKFEMIFVIITHRRWLGVAGHPSRNRTRQSREVLLKVKGQYG